MPSTPKRSKWLPALATAIGWRPQRLRFLFNKYGYKWPYVSELKGLQILVDAKISIAKYRPTEDAMGVKIVPSPKTAPGKGSTTATVAEVTGDDPQSKSVEDTPPKRSAWDLRLISRLAALTPLGRTKEGKKMAKAILVRRKYPGPKWDDEARALQCFVEEGISINGFEYANTPGIPGGATAPPETYEALLALYTELVERLKKTIAALDEKDKELTGLGRLLKTVKDILRQYQHLILNPKRFPELQDPLGYPMDALNAIRRYENPELYAV